jgi:hypothetical protein
MKSFKPILIIASISLLTLVGCNNAEKATTETTPGETPTSTTTVPEKTSTTGNSGLLTVVSKTKTAVKSGNFVQAKKEFDKFEDVWKEVEDGIKAKSRDNYDAIEESMDEISGELKAAKPEKNKLLGSLESLEKTINAVSKSS